LVPGVGFVFLGLVEVFKGLDESRAFALFFASETDVMKLYFVNIRVMIS